MRRIFFGASAFAIPLAVYACTVTSIDKDQSFIYTEAGSDVVIGADTAPSPLDQGCKDVAIAECTRNDRCSASFFNALRYGDEPTCEARVSTACRANEPALTASALESCATALASSCAGFIDNPPSACVTPAGAQDGGAACAVNAQCQSTFCEVGSSSACGVCAARPAGAGAACTAATPCARGLSCVMFAGKCAAEGAKAGAACDAHKQLAADCNAEVGLFCSGGVCAQAQLVGAGAGCGVGSDGSHTVCGAGSLCVANAAAPPSEAGADSGVEADAEGGVEAGAEGGVEASAGPTFPGTCASAVDVGKACDTSAGPPCLAPARCVLPGDGSTQGVCAEAIASACK